MEYLGIVLFMIILFTIVTLSNNSTNENLDTEKNNEIKYAECQFRLVGVTFNNFDNTSRQEILKKLNINDEVIFELYKYKNEDAFYVKTLDGKIIGNVPKIAVKNLKKRLESNLVFKSFISNIDKFIDENNKEIYFAKISVYFYIENNIN